jgi:exodeoxyribonuclease VII small subunit
MEKNFEESITELEKIVADLESGDNTLDESMKKFEEGMKLAKNCNELLEKAEKKISVVLEKNGEIVEEDM